MIYPEEKERENRFKLALRMGLPVFSLMAISFSALMYNYFETIPKSFVIIGILVFAVMIYYLFYLIYQGFDERVTDPITHTFTREFLTMLFKREIKKGPYTIMLVSVDNLHDINARFGTKNGDRILYNVAHRMGEYFDSKGMNKVPIGHYKGGDFFIGLKGNKNELLTIMELMCIKFENYAIDDIEISISCANADNSFSQNLDQLLDHLFELQNEKLTELTLEEEKKDINPTELENRVIEAVKKRLFQLMYQRVVEEDQIKIVDISVKLKSNEGKLIHQKSFMPVISRLGLLREFDTMVVEAAMQECCRVDESLIFAVAVSASSVRQQRFFDDMQMLFNFNEAARGRIMFILTEREFYHRIQHYNKLLQSYRRSGIQITLDRLGAFHTTMLYLKELNVDMVRFDASFGKEIKERGYRGILKGLSESAKFLGVRTWVKMIEDEEGQNLAREIGIDAVQGNYLGRIESLEEVLKKENDEIR